MGLRTPLVLKDGQLDTMLTVTILTHLSALQNHWKSPHLVSKQKICYNWMGGQYTAEAMGLWSELENFEFITHLPHCISISVTPHRHHNKSIHSRTIDIILIHRGIQHGR